MSRKDSLNSIRKIGYNGRMNTKHPFVLLVVLLIAAFACSTLPEEAPDPDQPPVTRRNGECSDERFEVAEEAAYQILINERADAARVREELITSGERLYRRDLSTANNEYQRALNACHDSNCTQTAMQTYNNSVESAQTYQNRRIGVARAEEAAALAVAQARYDAAVDEAKRLYCIKAYRADGQQQELSYTALICDLEQPFTVGATSPYYQFTIQLSPDNSSGGSFTYSGTWYDVGPVSGSGSYTVQYVDGDATQLILISQHTTSTEVGDVQGPPRYEFNLTPANAQDCVQP
jgi:hypothetical protein